MRAPGLRRFRKMALTHFLRELGRAFVRHRSLDLAAQLAFYSLLALFPFAMLIATTISALPVPGLRDQLHQLIHRFAPGAVAPLLQSAADNVITGGGTLFFLVGVGGTLLSASSGIAALIDSLNQAYGVEETRPWLKVRLRALILTVACTLLVVIMAVALLAGPGVVERIAGLAGLGPLWAQLWSWLRWPAAATAMALMLAFLYWACPNVRADWRLLSPGSLLAIPLWILLSLALDAYVSALPSFNHTYGALGAGIALLLWLQLTALVVIVGGEMNAVVAREAPREPARPAPRRPPAS